MVEKRTVLILALGRGYRYAPQGALVGICAAGQRRASLALQRATCFATAYPLATIYLVASAGREGSRTVGPTMAQLTDRYWGDQQAPFPTIINSGDYHVWGTFAEIEWLVLQLQRVAVDTETVVIEIVAAPRQDRRVRLMLRWFFPQLNATVVTSGESPIARYHEVLGYLKLCAYKFGIRRWADWFRRVSARPIKE